MMEKGFIFGNRIVDVALIAMFAAQLYKVFSPLLKGEKVNFARLFETGGMPSSHASTVTSLATSVAIVKGLSSVEFAISLVFASVVLYDASGIRRAAGDHAKGLNKVIKSIESREGIKIIESNFKEFLGHTHFEVFVGSVLGIIIAFVFKYYLLG